MLDDRLNADVMLFRLLGNVRAALVIPVTMPMTGVATQLTVLLLPTLYARLASQALAPSR